MDYDPQGIKHAVAEGTARPGRKDPRRQCGPAQGRDDTTQLPDLDTCGYEVMIIDAPAGVKGLLLQELVRRTNFIVIPVAPSPIDIHSTADFVKELFLFGGARTSKAKIAVVANRVSQLFIISLCVAGTFSQFAEVPFLTNIRDSEVYLDAVERGLGVFEMDEAAYCPGETGTAAYHAVGGWSLYGSGKKNQGFPGPRNFAPSEQLWVSHRGQGHELRSVRATADSKKNP